MFFRTAYDTTACSGYKLDKTIELLKIAYVNKELVDIGAHNIYSLIGGSAITNEVPSFAHPLLVNFDKNFANLVIDSRSYGKFNTQQNKFIVSNQVDYNILLARAKLNAIWLSGSPNILRDSTNIPMSIFASWIGEAISKRFALNPKEQFDLTILSAIFYNSLFSDVTVFEERDKLRLINIVTRSLRASAQDVITIVDKMDSVGNIFEFCRMAEKATDSIRLRELNPGLVFTILGGTWFGTNAKEMIAVAVEHPPTWIAMLLAAFNDRTFKNSQIVKITERSVYKKNSDEFIRAVLNIIK